MTCAMRAPGASREEEGESLLKRICVNGRKIAFYDYPTGVAQLISASLVGFPIYTLTRFRGMALSPPALRGLGLVAMLERESLKITDMGDIKLQKLSQDSGPKKFRNSMHMAEWTERIRRAAGQASEREFAIFLGGECSLVLGSLSGMKGSAKGEGRNPLDGRARGLQHPGDNPFRVHWWNVPRPGRRERTAPLTRNGRQWGAAPRGGCGGTPREQGPGPTRGDCDERVRDYARFCERTEKRRSRSMR